MDGEIAAMISSKFSAAALFPTNQQNQTALLPKPKKVSTAYMFFVKENRTKIYEEGTRNNKKLMPKEVDANVNDLLFYFRISIPPSVADIFCIFSHSFTGDSVAWSAVENPPT